MIIAHISDTHICLPEPPGSHRLADLKRAVVEINQLTPLPDIVVHTGDIVHNGSVEEYEAAHRLLTRLKMPLYVIPGNKDRRAVMGKVFANQIGGNGGLAGQGYFQYCVEEPSLRLIFLDTLKENNRLGAYCNTRLQHLEELLHAERPKPTLIFMHHPPFDVVDAPHPFQFDSRKTVDQLSYLLNKNTQVKEIFCGHSHRYASDILGQIRARTIPAVAIDLRRGEYGDNMAERPVFEVYQY